MTSEAHHLNSPPPAVSVKARAKEIEARTQAAGKGPPVASNEGTAKRYQASAGVPHPCRRCSEGDILKAPPLPPKQRRVSLEKAECEGSSSGGLCQTETTSKFAPFTGVTCRERATADFSPAIFSSSRLLAAAAASPLDDIITALERICDEFDLPESAPRPPLTADQRGWDDVFDTRRASGDVTQWPGIPCQDVSTQRKSFESILSTSSSQHSEDEPVVYRSSVQFSPRQRHAVSATLQVSPPKRNFESSERRNIEKSLRFNNTTVLLERSDEKCTADTKLFISETHSSLENDTSSVKPPRGAERNVISNNTHLSERHLNIAPAELQKVRPDLEISEDFSFCESAGEEHYNESKESENEDWQRYPSSEELATIKSILANLDFEKYKRRGMEEKSPKPTRAQKSNSVKLKDLFDLFKSDNASGSHNKPFGLCRSSSFSLPADQTPEARDDISPLPEDTKKISTLPRRKNFMVSSPPPPVPAVASCPSIVKLEPHPPPESDEGLVSDSDAGPGAYVTEYVSCVTATSGRRGHVRSASDNVTSVSSTPEVRLKKTLSTEKLWTSVASRLNAAEKRKRRKGEGATFQEAGAGRSLTYPPQRKSSTSEEEQEYSSVDSNGLKSLKLLTAGLMDSGTDVVRLLSDLSLADSHLCPSEGTVDETYLDSVMHSPNDGQHLSVEEPSSSNGKLQKKKHHSDPCGEVCSSGPGDAMGSSRSEPDLGGNKNSSSTKATQTLKLVMEGSKHIRTCSSGSLTSGATPHSRFQFPDADANYQRLSSKSPQEQRRYSKRRLRGPYGEMLEEEMRKSGEKQKPAYSDLSFLQDLGEAAKTENVNPPSSRPAMFLSSQSLDDASSTASRNDLTMCVTPKRKISANYPLLTDGESVAIASDEDITPTKPLPSTDAFVNCESGENTLDTKHAFPDKPKEDNKGLNEPAKINDRHSDTRTHVVGELYDTEKSYVESLQILANVSDLDFHLQKTISFGLFSRIAICWESMQTAALEDHFTCR